MASSFAKTEKDKIIEKWDSDHRPLWVYPPITCRLPELTFPFPHLALTDMVLGETSNAW